MNDLVPVKLEDDVQYWKFMYEELLKKYNEVCARLHTSSCQNQIFVEIVQS